MPLVAQTSPHLVVFAMFDATTGAPVTGAAGSVTFDYYGDDQGSAIGAPAVTEVGTSGIYKFTPVFPASALRGLVYMVNLGAGHTPRRIYEYVRPEGFDEDMLKQIKQFEAGRRKVVTTGPDAFRLIAYDNDNATALQKWDQKDVSGNPTAVNPFSIDPV